ncbi:MAG TPA: glycosyltransferase [Tepidisphaeraceae bacterium]|nr:glycosyltransferase [Tepidisphaeraceae bacterium]
MTRVLQLLDDSRDFQAHRSVEVLARGDLGPEFDVQVRTIGRGGEFRNVTSAVRGLWRQRPDAFDIVHAWGRAALTSAAVAGRWRIAFTPSRFLGPRGVGWVRAVMAYRDVHVVCTTATQRRVCVERGVPIDRAHLVRPGVEFARVRRRRDPDLRRKLGFSDEDVVVLAAGESTRAAAHEDAVTGVAIAHYLDPRFRLLLWGRGVRAGHAARRAAIAVRGGNLASVAEARLARAVEFEELLPAADAVVVTARGPVATLPIAICMAAGLPIVSTVTYTVAELLEDRHTALMTPAGAPRRLARRLVELREDAGTQWTIADTARTEAYEYFSLTRFLDQFRAAYRQIATGAKVEVPEPAPGAGRRFHGRV